MGTHLDNSPEDRNLVDIIMFVIIAMIFGSFLLVGIANPHRSTPPTGHPSPTTMMASR